MSSDPNQQPLRDMNMSEFGVALEIFSQHHQQVEIAILYDAFGETIDYYSRRDPFVARLAAAHHGLIFGSAQARLHWLKLGNIEIVEITATQLDSLTVEIGEEIYLTVVVTHNAVDPSFLDALDVLVSQLPVPPRPPPAIGEIAARSSASRGPRAHVPKPPIECPVRWIRSMSTL